MSTRSYLKPPKFRRRAVEEGQDPSKLAGDHVDGGVDVVELFLDAFEKSRQTDRRLRQKCKHNWPEPYFFKSKVVKHNVKNNGAIIL